MDVPICSAPAATVCTSPVTPSAATLTVAAWALVFFAPVRISAAIPDSRVALSDTASDAAAIELTASRVLSQARVSAIAIAPSSSRESRTAVAVRSPAASASSAEGREQPRLAGRKLPAVVGDVVGHGGVECLVDGGETGSDPAEQRAGGGRAGCRGGGGEPGR